MIAIEKSPILVEDLRNHTPEQMAELHALLDAGVVGRPDPQRPGFYEVDGAEDVYFVFRYPAGGKVLLIAAWQKARG
jgi:acyl-CoA-binding protein